MMMMSLSSGAGEGAAQRLPWRVVVLAQERIPGSHKLLVVELGGTGRHL